MSISIATTYTNPEKRCDPWKEAISCYEDFADEIIVTGQNWPYEFSWNLIGETFQEGFDQATSDWVLRMDIDYFLHEKYINKLRHVLNKYSEYPAVCFPQFQFFTPTRFHLKTRLCIALNKKKFPEIKLNGGGDLCLATINSKLIEAKDVPNINIPIYQYDSLFRTKEVISEDRSRFAKAWYNYFGNYGDRGGALPEEAYKAWLENVQRKYQFHTNKLQIKNHPKYIKNKLYSLEPDQFGYNLFGLTHISNNYFKNFITGKKDIYFGHMLNNIKRNLNF